MATKLSTQDSTSCTFDQQRVTVTAANGTQEDTIYESEKNTHNRHSIALFVYEPKTGRTRTKLFRKCQKRKTLNRRECYLCTYSTIITLALLITVTLMILQVGGIRLFSGISMMVPSALSMHDEPCFTPQCMSTATQMLLKLNTSMDPCHDFYEFTCGRWTTDARIPAGYMFWSTLNELSYSTMEMLRNEYENPTIEWIEAEQKAISIYKSCMDIESISRRGVEPLRRFMNRLGGWSLINSNMNFTNWSLAEELNKMFSIGLLPVIWVGAVMDDRNTCRHVIGIDQAQITLRSREQYMDLETGTRMLFTNETPLSWLKTWVTYTGVLLGANESVAEERADRLVEFETRLAQLNPKKKSTPSLYHMTSLSELQNAAPVLNWRQFLGKIFNDSDLRQDEPILVYGWNWLKNLNSLLSEYTKTEDGRRTLDDYMKWCAAFRLTPTLDRNLFNDNASPLYKILLGLVTSPPRWLECAMHTEGIMGLAVSSLYIKLRGASVFDIRRQASHLVNEMVIEIQNHLRRVSWMDEPTKIKALKKLSVKDDEYFENTLAAFRFTRGTVVNLLRKNPSRTQWDSSIAPVHVNAYYGFPLNRIVFPLALLQSPVFDIKNPATINYAMIGSIVGHELVHAFDDTGKEYDDTGSLNRWWSPMVYETSAIRGQCLVDQYNNYSFHGIQLDGARTLNENVADFDGLNIAYKAFKRSLDSHRHYVLPGMNMTSEQLFFVSYAQLWCQKAAEAQFRRLQMLLDTHSIEKFRVIGPLSNFAPFAEAFRCPVGSIMNPVTKCNVH